MSTQIYGTFGPSCGDGEILKKMIEAGMTGMRLNLSHTTLAASEKYIRSYQKQAEASGVTPQILIDMQGPELRLGNLKPPVWLEEGQKVRLGKGEIEVPKEVIAVAQRGDSILLDDGKIKGEV